MLNCNTLTEILRKFLVGIKIYQNQSETQESNIVSLKLKKNLKTSVLDKFCIITCYL